MFLLLQVKRLLEGKNPPSVMEATDQVGISRSSFYKYKDDIFPFHDDSAGKTVTMMLSLDDAPGLLSRVTKKVAESEANVLTIHQSIPVGGIATLTMSLQLQPSCSVEELMDSIEKLQGVYSLKILARS